MKILLGRKKLNMFGLVGMGWVIVSPIQRPKAIYTNIRSVDTRSKMSNSFPHLHELDLRLKGEMPCH